MVVLEQVYTNVLHIVIAKDAVKMLRESSRRVYPFSVNVQNSVYVKASNLSAIPANNDNDPVFLSKLYAQCKPLIFWLNLMGNFINFDSVKGDDSLGRCKKAYQYIICLCCAVKTLSFANTTYAVFQKLLQSGSFDFLMVTDIEPGLALITCVVLTRRRKRINAEIRKLINTLGFMNLDKSKSLKSIRKASIGLSLLSMVIYTIHLSLQIAKIPLMQENHVKYLMHYYFDLDFGKFVYTKLFFHFFDNFYFLIVIMVSDFTCLFCILLCLLLAECYSNFNACLQKWSSQRNANSHIIQHWHFMIGNYVKNINGLFSPIMFFNVVHRAFKIVFFIKLRITRSDKPDPNVLWIVDYEFLFMLIKEIVLCLTFMLAASAVFIKSRETVHALLGAILKNRASLPDEDAGKCRNYHVTNLLMIQQLNTPVGITGSNLFIINYEFVSVVISTIVTYLSILSSLQ